jgi:predicted peptidase
MPLEYQVDGRRRRAALWVPPGYDPARRWPLVVFLHAYEERGDDEEHLAVGLAPTLARHPELYRALVLMPQCPADRVWVELDRPWAEGFPGAEHHVDAALNAALAEYPIDEARVSLTGCSMGGYAAFVHGSRRRGIYRAFAPICGGGEEEHARALAGAPLWAFHGDQDEVVPVDESRCMVAALRAAGGDPRYSELAGRGHEIWGEVYADPALAAFLAG